MAIRPTIKRCLTAPRRFKHSRGFGVHSPFAFNFILRVLSERTPYYAYEGISSARRKACRLISRLPNHPRAISLKNAKMLFRIVNFFTPEVVLQIGASYGVSTLAALSVNDRLRVVMCAPSNPYPDVFRQVLGELDTRVARYARLNEAAQAYMSQMGERPLAMCSAVEGSVGAVADVLVDVINAGGTVVMRNISSLVDMSRVWVEVNSRITHGMSFTNERIGVIVGLKHLPRQRISMWF